MPYDDVIPDEYAAGKIEQTILAMKMLLFGSPLVGILLFSKGYIGEHEFVIFLLPTFYVILVGIPSKKMFKDNGPKIVDNMVFNVNVVVFTALPYLAFPNLYTKIHSLLGLLSGLFILLIGLIVGYIYQEFLCMVKADGPVFVALLLLPTFTISIIFPESLIYSLVVIPVLIARDAVRKMNRTSSKSESSSDGCFL